MAPPAFTDKEWRKEVSGQEYLVSTSLDKLDIEFINKSFESEAMYWAKRLSEEEIRIMLSQSLTLGLYKVLPARSEEKTADSPSSPRTPSPTIQAQHSERLQQIGIARFISDYVTFAYLTDVYLVAEERGRDLGKWMIRCCQTVLEGIPNMRRAMLLTSPVVGKRFYSRELGFWDAHEEAKDVIVMTRRTYSMGSG